jgi:hypothetical protein
MRIPNISSFFFVETTDRIAMCEKKARNEMKDAEVPAKKEAALE